MFCDKFPHLCYAWPSVLHYHFKFLLPLLFESNLIITLLVVYYALVLCAADRLFQLFCLPNYCLSVFFVFQYCQLIIALLFPWVSKQKSLNDTFILSLNTEKLFVVGMICWDWPTRILLLKTLRLIRFGRNGNYSAIAHLNSFKQGCVVRELRVLCKGVPCTLSQPTILILDNDLHHTNKPSTNIHLY